MAISSRIVKITAKTTLKNNFLASVCSALILIFSAFVGIFVSSYLGTIAGEWLSYVLLAIYSLFLILPLGYGVLRFFWRSLFSVNDNPISVFYYFSDKKLYKKCIKIIFTLVMKAIIPAILLAIPVVVLFLVSKGLIFEWMDITIPLWTANLSYIYIFVKNLAIILLVVYMFKYYLSPLFFVADENMDIDEAIYMSKLISKKSAIDFSYLFFSFWVLIIISLLVLPLIFTLPYFFLSYAVHFRFVVAEYNKHAEKCMLYGFPYFEEDI